MRSTQKLALMETDSIGLYRRSVSSEVEDSSEQSSDLANESKLNRAGLAIAPPQSPR
jgi:hypothetical protein